MSSPLVSIVILNLNGLHYTLKCLDSIRKSAYKNIEIIVVDNGSSDDSVKELSKRRDIKLMTNKKNLGFAEGNNVGVRVAKGKYVCLLNNDTKVDEFWLSELVKASETDPSIVICNPTFFDKYEAKDYHFYGYGTIGLFHSPVFLKQIDKYTQHLVASLTARGSAFFRKDVIGEPFDPDYFAYAEDAHLGWRANLNGYKVVNVPRSIVYHEGGATAKRMKVPKDFFFILAERNKMLNMLTMYSILTLIRLIPYAIAYGIFSNIYDFRHFFARLKVFAWFVANFDLVMEKRKDMQSKRKVPDKKIIKLMSFKLYDETYVKNKFFRLLISGLNMIFYAYCWLVFLRTIEFHKIKVRDGVIGPNG